MTEIRITVRNTSDEGGTFTTPFYFGFHDENFDMFDVGSAASPGLEALAEDGTFGEVAAERLAASPDSQGLVVAGADGPIATQERTSNTTTVDGMVNPLVSFAAMILPSNDAFIGTDDAVMIFDEDGKFIGAQEIVFEGDDVYDAGTEVNTELDAAFLNQMAPDTGVDEGGVIRLHPGFNGSDGNPVGEGDQNILGGTNAFGVAIDEVAADFTLPGAQVAVVHINTVVETDGTSSADKILGGSDDDIVNAGGGRDFIIGRSGWDDLNGEAGRDKILGGQGADLIKGGTGGDWLGGGADDDIIYGEAGRDEIFAGRGDDKVEGGTGGDWISGGSGDDMLAGGLGQDTLSGGHGDDMFVFVAGDRHDTIRDFDRRGDDVIVLDVDGIDDLADVLAVATETAAGVELDFGSDGSLFLRGVELSDLGSDDFTFV